jgi:hypothetical protein
VNRQVPNSVRSEQTQSSSFVHDPMVLKQVEECLKFSPSRMMTYVSTLNSSDTKIREEALVILARRFALRGSDTIAWKLVQILCDRVTLSIARSAQLWRLSPVVAEEVIEVTLSHLYDSVLASQESAQFWEIRFWVCFDRYLLSVLRRHRILGDKFVPSVPMDEMTVDTTQTRTPAYNWHDPSLRVVVAEGLAQLPGQYRTAFMLKHWAGFPESSVNPADKATIAAVMGVSDRTVRNYLSRAESILNSWRTSEAVVDNQERQTG